ncbi:MAG: class I SAM-dependent methyltransferase [Rhizomicrobium sp.]|jgi:S-adenosylmethionine-diacylgycerolhomoserine-N-methlytransferase
METRDHSALMDQVYRRQRHIYDLTRKYYLFGRDRVIRNLGLRDGESLVEIGCGTARNLIAIGRRYPGARLFGLDASHEMLRTAQENVEKESNRRQGNAKIKLTQAYAEALNLQTFGPDSGPFDRALFSYSLSMIPDWEGALAAAAGALCPEGVIDIVDFGDLKGLGALSPLIRAWLGLFHVQPRAALLEYAQGVAGLSGAQLWVSPGRYAFSVRLTPDLARQLGSVAGASHNPVK